MGKDVEYFKKSPKRENAVGYCANRKHRGYLSEAHLKAHKCTKKQCPFFEKYDSHPYWVEKRCRKQNRKAIKKGENILILRDGGKILNTEENRKRFRKQI